MGPFIELHGGPADAGRALPGFRYALIPYGDAVRPSDPCRLRAAGAARFACPLHVAAMQPRAARPVRACERPVWPRHGFAVAREGRSPWVRLAAHGGPGRGAGNHFRDRSPFLDCPSEPPIAAQSLDGGGLRPAPLRSACNASCQRAGLRLKAAPCGRFLMLAPAFGFPAVMPPCSSPKPRHRPAGRSLRGDFVRRLRRAEPSRKGEQA